MVKGVFLRWSNGKGILFSSKAHEASNKASFTTLLGAQ